MTDEEDMDEKETMDMEEEKTDMDKDEIMDMDYEDMEEEDKEKFSDSKLVKSYPKNDQNESFQGQLKNSKTQSHLALESGVEKHHVAVVTKSSRTSCQRTYAFGDKIS